jgi:endoglucanase
MRLNRSYALWAATLSAALGWSCAEPDASPTPLPLSDAGVARDAAALDAGSVDAATEARAPLADATAEAAVATTFVGEHGALRAVGGKIVDARGTPTVLKGMSLFWSQWGSTYWNAGAVETLRKDWGATVVRAAMGVESGGYQTDGPREKARVLSVVDAAIVQGIYVIIDWHDHNAHQHSAEAQAFFADMAQTYRNVPNVLFEVYNEPIDASWAQVKQYAEGVTAVIRGKGATNLVLVGSPHWSQDVDLAANNPLADSNVAYTLHFYAASHKAELRAKATTALGKGITLFVSEWGSPDASGAGSVDAAETQVWLDFLKTRQISWCNWSLFDKPEAASALKPGASATGPWPDSMLTQSGLLVKSAMRTP